MKKKIQKINHLLINHFGAAPKAKKLPDPLDIIIGTILSQNTNDINSYKAFRNLKDNFKNWDELALLKSQQIEKYIRIAGLGKQKAKAIYQLLQSLKKNRKKLSLNHIKKGPDEKIIEELTSYNGVGLKTAACVLLFSLGRNVCPVDTHVHRVLNRVGVVNTKSPDKTFLQISDSIPQNGAHSLHTNLIRLGRQICKPKNPHCLICPLNKICQFPDKNLLPMSNSMSIKDFMLLDSI